MRPPFNGYLRWAGSALAIAGIAFVVLRLRDYGAEMDFTRFGVFEWTVVTGLAVVYGLGNLMLAVAWWHLLGQFGVHISRRWAVRAYAVSQLAKYVPGNIFHLAGRQAIGLAAGVSGWVLAKSALFELSLISGTAVFFFLLVAPLVAPVVSVAVSVGTFLVTIGLCAGLLWRFKGPSVAFAFGWYAGFLTLSGTLFVGLVQLFSETPISGYLLFPLLGAYVIAWIAGLVTPGAPAGIGVRELVLIILLGGVIGDGDLVFAVLVARMVTVVGDVLIYIAAAMPPFNSRENDSP